VWYNIIVRLQRLGGLVYGEEKKSEKENEKSKKEKKVKKEIRRGDWVCLGC